MNIYYLFTYEQLKIVLSQNPNDLEAKKQLDLIESKALNSNNLHFYSGPIMVISAILMHYLGLSSTPYSVIPLSCLGVFIIGLNIDNYLLKKSLLKV